MAKRAGMTHAQAAALLVRANSRFLAGLSEEEINAVVATGTIRYIPANTVITTGDDPALRLYLLVEGRLRAFIASHKGEKHNLLWAVPGETVGWSCLMAQQMDYIVSAEAVKASVMLVWERPVARSLTAKYSRLLENALLLGYDYLVFYRVQHLAALCNTAPERVVQVLCGLAEKLGHKGNGGFELKIRNEELANEANVTIFTVSRLMGEWQRKGLVKKLRGSVVLRLGPSTSPWIPVFLQRCSTPGMTHRRERRQNPSTWP
jgi:CRP-like cAMP-binding protein